jgi:hypothetical protein
LLCTIKYVSIKEKTIENDVYTVSTSDQHS